ncbi:hypothetical protein QF042_003972 [Pedobacter sp. W3I1]|nr:hypothetical protein [Pedobacter sp. W3I1]
MHQISNVSEVIKVYIRDRPARIFTNAIKTFKA